MTTLGGSLRLTLHTLHRGDARSRELEESRRFETAFDADRMLCDHEGSVTRRVADLAGGV